MARIARRAVVAGIAGAGVAGIGGRVFGSSVLTGGANAPDAELLELFAEWRALAAESVLRQKQLEEFMARHEGRFSNWKSPNEMPPPVRAEYDALWARVDREIETDKAGEVRCARLWALEKAITALPGATAEGIFARTVVLIWREAIQWGGDDWAEPDSQMTLMRALWSDIESQAPALRLAGLLTP